MKKKRERTERESTISLINIIFLILIFFMISGTISTPSLPSLEFVQTTELECCAGSHVLEIADDGSLFVYGESIPSVEAYLASLPDDEPTVRIVPDHRLPANKLLSFISELRKSDAKHIVIVTENN